MKSKVIGGGERMEGVKGRKGSGDGAVRVVCREAKKDKEKK